MSGETPAHVYDDKICASEIGCRKQGAFVCSGCKAATPPTLYCSAECQKKDWRFHKKFCGKQAYTFEITLIDSSDPVISRTIDIPSWFTFEELHFTLQYAFNWNNGHLHYFAFHKAPENAHGDDDFFGRQTVLKLTMACEVQDDLELNPEICSADERTVRLSDVYDPAGKYHGKVEHQGTIAPVLYAYDYGDNWEHRVTFKGSKLARAARPLFSAASGWGGIEDAGGVCGLDDVKEAFAAENPTPDQLERRKWARWACGFDEGKNDPLALGGPKPWSPLNEPNIVVYNYEGRWENHYEAFKRSQRAMMAHYN